MITTRKELDETDRLINELGVAITQMNTRLFPRSAPDPPSWHKYEYVYLIQSTIGGPVKIGFSVDADQRRKTLQLSSPYPLLVIRLFQFDVYMGCARSLESYLHNKFSKERIHGEWFNDTVIGILDTVAERFKFNFYEKKVEGLRAEE